MPVAGRMRHWVMQQNRLYIFWTMCASRHGPNISGTSTNGISWPAPMTKVVAWVNVKAEARNGQYDLPLACLSAPQPVGCLQRDLSVRDP